MDSIQIVMRNVNWSNQLVDQILIQVSQVVVGIAFQSGQTESHLLFCSIVLNEILPNSNHNSLVHPFFFPFFLQIDHVVIGRGPAGGSWHRMDPNLRTLSLAAWMGLPGLDFNEWDAKQTAADEAVAGAAPVTNSNLADGCLKCEALRAGGKSVMALSKCRCSAAQKKASNKENGRVGKGASPGKGGAKKGNSPEKTKGTTTIEIGGSVPRRNLSLKRLMSKEVETRALISRVAQYYENYVIEMGLEKYFMNNAIVTCVWPIRMCFDNFNGKFRKAKWFVSG